MLGGVRHYLGMRKALRHRVGRKRDYARDIQAARARSDYQEVENLKNQEHMELRFSDEEIDIDNSDYLIAQAHRYLVPLPQGEEYWDKSEPFGRTYLSREGAAKLRGDIRAEKKAMWDYWQARVTLILALIGSIFGVLAYFRK